MTRIAVPRMLLVLTPAVLVAAVAAGLVGATRATGASAGVTPAAPIPACLTGDVAGTVTGQPGDGYSGVRDAVLRLVNTSGRICQVGGWADVAMVTPPGELVPVPTRKVGTAGAAIVLQPKAAAWSRLQWDTCRPGRKGCGVGVALQYIIDPESTGEVADLAKVPEADGAGITMKALRVGPLIPNH